MTPQTLAVLAELLDQPGQPRYGLELAEATRLRIGTMHPILKRLESAGWLRSYWAEPAEHERAGRPRRRYYEFTPHGMCRARHATSAGAAPAARFPGPRGVFEA